MATEAPASDTFELVQFLTQSRNRPELLTFLRENGSCRRRDCEAALGVARTTVQRNLDALVDRGWVEETPAGYRVTACGRYVETVFGEFADDVETLQRLEPFLRWIPTEEFDIDLAALSDARVTANSAENPYAPANRHVAALREAEEFRLLTAVVGRDAFEQLRNRIVNHDAEGELILTNEALETVRTAPGYRRLFADVRDADALDLFVVQEGLPYYLGLIDGLVQVGVEDDEQFPRALLESETAAMREWAAERYATVRERAAPVG
jgi:predicted transcriptional regulator